MKGNNKHPSTVPSAYDMLTRFELVAPRHNFIKRKVDKWNRENCGGSGGGNHTIIQHTAPLGTLLITGLDGRASYYIKLFNYENWGHYDNQCPETTRDRTPNNSGQNLAQIGRGVAQGSSGGAVSYKWILLDSCSTINCTKNN